MRLDASWSEVLVRDVTKCDIERSVVIGCN